MAQKLRYYRGGKTVPVFLFDDTILTPVLDLLLLLLFRVDRVPHMHSGGNEARVRLVDMQLECWERHLRGSKQAAAQPSSAGQRSTPRLPGCTPPSAFFAPMVREAGQNPRIAACPSTHVCSLSATLRCDVRSPVPCLARAERCEPLPTRLHRDCSRLLAADQFVALVHALRHGRMWTQDAVRIHVAPATFTSDHVHLAL